MGDDANKILASENCEETWKEESLSSKEARSCHGTSELKVWVKPTIEQLGSVCDLTLGHSSCGVP